MENNFASLVGQANSVLILLAKNPYVDQVAAGLSLYLAFKKAGKNPTIASSSEMMVAHNRLVGVDEVTSDPGNKNLVIKFSNYQADNIERVSYDVDGQEFSLTVIPKTQFDPPQKDNIQFSYSGISADLVILIGGMNESHFPLLATGQLAGVQMIHLGVQPFTERENKVQSFVEGTASTSELIARFIKSMNIELDQDMSTNLLMGMQEGTRNFSHSKVTAQTFHLAGELMEKGASLDPRQAEEQKQYPPGAIPGQQVQIPQQPRYESTPYRPQQAQPQQQPQQPSTSKPVGENNKEQQSENPEQETPPSWLEPKIYKGTSKN